MKQLLIGILSLAALSAHAEFQNMDGASLSVTSKDVKMAASYTVSIVGEQAERMYFAILSTGAKEVKFDLGDGMQTESEGKDVKCLKQEITTDSKFYSCVIANTL